jgi:uncharacterized LabA/DUF88 family protein
MNTVGLIGNGSPWSPPKHQEHGRPRSARSAAGNIITYDRNATMAGNEHGSIAILWDIENVTPSTDSLFVRGLIDYASELGRVSIARAYGDWTRSGIKHTAEMLADNSFEMVHVPKSKKNSADVTLSTQAVELIYQYRHIGKLVLVTGDADFRPLLQSIRKQNIESIVICDAKSASEDLLLLADEYKDFRDIIPDSDALESEEPGTKQNRISYPEAVSLLKESVSFLIRNKRTPSLGAAKVRMKLLNEGFDEEKLGFRSWKAFVLKAKADGAIETRVQNNDLLLELPDEKDELPEIIGEFLRGIAASLTDQGRAQGEWLPLATVSNYLRERGVDYKKHGYNRFKKLAEAIEKRGLIEHTTNDAQFVVRLVGEGTRFFA